MGETLQMTNKYILELFTVSMNASRNPTCQEPSHEIKNRPT